MRLRAGNAPPAMRAYQLGLAMIGLAPGRPVEATP
jgi:hypothetical protein